MPVKHPVVMFAAWLCSMLERDRFVVGGGARTRTVRLNDLSRETLPPQVGHHPPSSDAAHGRILISTSIRALTGEMQLEDTGRSQLHFWRACGNLGFNVPFLVFTVMAVASLQHGPLQVRPPGTYGKSRTFFRAVPDSFGCLHNVQSTPDAPGHPYTQQSAQLCLYLPHGMVSLVMQGLWKHVLLPRDFSIGIGWGLLRRFGLAPAQIIDEISPHMSAEARQWRASPFQSNLAPAIAKLFRRVLEHVRVNHLPMELRTDVSAILECCDNQHSHGEQGLQTHQGKKMQRLLHALFMADRLRSDANLRPMIKAVAIYVFGSEQGNSVVAELETLPVPSKFQLSKARFKADAAFMLLMRNLNHTSGQAARYLMLDSSPQFHRDYEQIVEKKIYTRDLPDLLRSSQRLGSMWDGVLDPDNFDLEQTRALAEEEAALFVSISHKIVWHTLPPVLVGFGVSDLSRKIHAILHAVRLECTDHADFARYCAEIVCVVSDMGTEYGRRCAEKSGMNLLIGFIFLSKSRANIERTGSFSSTLIEILSRRDVIPPMQCRFMVSPPKSNVNSAVTSVYLSNCPARYSEPNPRSLPILDGCSLTAN